MTKTYLKTFKTLLAQTPANDEVEDELLFDCPSKIHQDSELDGIEHLSCNQLEGTWRCLHCEASGNIYQLLKVVHQLALEETTEDHYEELGSIRNIRPDILKLAQWAYQPDKERWLVPFFRKDPTKTPLTLGYFYWRSRILKSRFVIKKLSKIPVPLYNPGIKTTNSSKIFVTEGEWDTVAWLQMTNKKYQTFGKPGSGFTEDMSTTLKAFKKPLALLLDNDKPGRQQTEQVATSLSKIMKREQIEVLDWSIVPDAPKDIRDMLIAKRKSKEILESLRPCSEVITFEENPEDDEEKELTPGHAPDVTVFAATQSFTEYTKQMRKYMIVGQHTEQAIAGCLSITQGLRIPGEGLWSFLKGPASSGKTKFINSFGGNNQLFESLSKLTPKSLISGARMEEDWGIQRWKGKSVLIKDFTTTCMGSSDALRDAFGLLTDIFDGHSTFTWGNGKVLELHNMYFNIIAGVTDIINAHSAASIGERFLRIDYLGDTYDPMEYARSVFRNLDKSDESNERLTELTLGFVNGLHETELQPFPEEYEERIAALAVFTAHVRTRVETDRELGIVYRPRPELPPRLVISFTKLFRGLQLVYRDLEDDDLIKRAAYQVVRKIALDTCSGFTLDMVMAIQENPEFTRKELVEHANIQAIRAHRVLNDLCTTGVLLRNKSSDISTRNGRGKPPWHYKLNPNIQAAVVFHDETLELEKAERANNYAKKRRRRTLSSSSVRKPKRFKRKT